MKKYEHDLHNKVSIDWLLALGDTLGIARVPGIGLVYSDVISCVPANFSRFVTNLPAFHKILVFVCIKYVPVPFVSPTERYLVGRVGPPDHRSYRCIVRYGYRDVHQDIDCFETELLTNLAEFITYEGRENMQSIQSANMTDNNGLEIVEMAVREELQELKEAQEAGTAFILGHSHVRVKSGSSLIKKLAINVAYNFLRRNCRGSEVALRVPPASLLEVGMVYVL